MAKQRLKCWRKDLENKKAGRLQTRHYLRKDKKSIISLNLYDDGFHFSHFPLGKNGEGKYFVKEKLTEKKAISLAKSYMKKHNVC